MKRALPRRVVLAEPLAHDVGDLADGGERLDRAEDRGRRLAVPAAASSSAVSARATSAALRRARRAWTRWT
jgi:hypothetical protein